MVKSAGLAIIYNKMILLTHPTGALWWSSYGIPKGWVEQGEDIYSTAIRETKEEVGIQIPSELIDSQLHSFYYMKDNQAYKQIFYYVARINTLDNIKLSGLVVPKSQLQLEEVDWAGFLNYDDAIKRILPLQNQLLNLIK